MKIWFSSMRFKLCRGIFSFADEYGLTVLRMVLEEAPIMALIMISLSQHLQV